MTSGAPDARRRAQYAGPRDHFRGVCAYSLLASGALVMAHHWRSRNVTYLPQLIILRECTRARGTGCLRDDNPDRLVHDTDH